MPHELILIADAVAAVIGGAALSQAVTVRRRYVPKFDLEEMTGVQVSVVPKGGEITHEGRGSGQYDYKVDVGVQKKFTEPDIDAEADEMMGLVQEIAALFFGRRLDGYDDAAWTKTEYIAPYSPEHMDQMHQFTSVFTLTFQVVR